MTSLTRVLLLLVLALPACRDDGDTDGGRPPAGRYGLVAFNVDGFEPLTADRLPIEHWSEGYADVAIRHPLDALDAPAPTELVVALQFGWPRGALGPLRRWGGPDRLHARIRTRDTVPLETRTLFTADMRRAHLRLEYQPSATAPSLRYEGEGQLEVFAADLKTGAAWGRLTGELRALDSDDGPHTISVEFAALPGPIYCAWEIPTDMVDGYRGVSEPPEGRADTCTPALEAIMAAEAHPDAPPVPDFQPVFYGVQRPPARWDGLDRDL